MPELSVVVFAFNEEENVSPVLTELREWLEKSVIDAEIVFVDDGSSDLTAEQARLALENYPHAIVEHETNCGIGAAIKSGVRHARAPWVTFMPADGQIAPSSLGQLRDTAMQSDAALVFSVYANRNDGWHRTVLSWGVRTLIRVLHGVRMTSDGPYLFRRELFVPDELPPDSFFLNFEFPIRMLRAKHPHAVVTISCRPRRSGQSKSSNMRTIFIVARDLIDLRLRTLGWKKAMHAAHKAR